VSALGLGTSARRAHAERPVLRIAQWAHFVPAYDEWFDRKFARAWGDRHGVTVEVDHLALSELRARADTEVATQQGHDLFALPVSPVAYEPHVMPVTDVMTEAEHRFGKLPAFAHKSTFNPRTKQYFAVPESWAPGLLHYRRDLWEDAGAKPDTWELVREGTRKIHEKRGIPAGFGLAPEPDSNMMLRSLIWAFGGAEQDDAGQVAINSPATIEAVKLMATIYRESLNSDVFMWDAASNNRAFVWGRGLDHQNPISAIRSTGEGQSELAKRRLARRPPRGRPRASGRPTWSSAT
jgi:multiple sugar transport system substrate-binding protein